MNVFIIGASAYIGRAVTQHVLSAGHRVTALVRSEASVARLPAGDVRSTSCQQFRFQRNAPRPPPPLSCTSCPTERSARRP